MGKDVAWTSTYDASAESAFAVLSDEAFLTQLARDTGSLTCDVHAETAADGSVTITNSRSFPAEIPSYAKSLVGDTITVTEVQRWGPADANGARSGTFEVGFGSAPVKFGGTLSLTGNSPCTASTSGNVRASIPLVGGKVEGLVADQISAYMGELEAHAKAALA